MRTGCESFSRHAVTVRRADALGESLCVTCMKPHREVGSGAWWTLHPVADRLSDPDEQGRSLVWINGRVVRGFRKFGGMRLST